MAIDFTLTDEQELLVESVEEFIKNAEHGDEYFKKIYEEGLYPQEYLKEWFNSPLGTLGIPEEFGGTEMDAMTMAAVGIKIASMDRPALTSIMTNMHSIATYGNAKQKQTAVDAMHEGLMPAALAMTEPQAGSDNSALQTSYVKKDGKYIINGHKCLITNADHTKQLQVLARDFTKQDKYSRTMTMFMIPAETPGIKIVKQNKIGCNHWSLCEVYLDNVEVDETCVFGQEYKGFYTLMKNFEIERLLLCCTALGMSMVAYEDALAYAKNRVCFGKTISEYQLIQKKLVDSAMKIENMRNFIYKVAWMIDNNQPIRAESSMCKYYCVTSQNQIIDDCLQIFGGIGYTSDARVSRLWRDARTNRIGGGTDEILIYNTSKVLLG